MSEDNVTIENETLQTQYAKAVELFQSDSLQDVLQAREMFKELSDYRDASTYINQCSEKIALIRANKILDKYSDEEQVVNKRPEPVPQATPQPAPTVAASPKKQSKIGFIIAAIVLIAAVFVGGLALGGFFNKGNTGDNRADGTVTDTAPDTAESDFDQEDEDIPETLEFSKANILEFELLDLFVEQDMDNTKRAAFKVTNKGKDIVWYASSEIQFLDKDGNEIYQDGRSFRGKLEPGKSCYMDSYSYDVDTDEIASVNVKSYDYMVGQINYMVDLQTKSVEVEREDAEWYSNVDFDKANILEISLGEGEGDSDGNVTADITVKNKGSNNIKELSLDIPYYNKNKDVLYLDSRYSDSLLKSGKSVRIQTYASPDYYYGSDKIDSYGITGYQYVLQDKDEKGYNRYTVNLVTNTAYGEYESE